MKTLAWWAAILALGAGTAAASMNVEEDPSGETALLTWRHPVPWQVGTVYSHLVRTVAFAEGERELRGESVDVAIGVSPWAWLLLYGQAGALFEGRLRGAVDGEFDPGADGLLGARLNLWQIYRGVDKTSWRFTVQLAGQYAYRTGADNGAGTLAWGETLVMLPVNYHLTFARVIRNVYIGEFQSLGLYAGPAYSRLDGTWELGDVERDFEETRAVGIVGGADLWLLENLSFGVRADWFDDLSLQLAVRYRF